MAVNSFRKCPVSQWHGWTNLTRYIFHNNYQLNNSKTSKCFYTQKVEKEIVSCLKDAGSALAEVAKDKPSQKQVLQKTSKRCIASTILTQVDLLVTQFMNSLGTIDTSLTEHIKYLSQVNFLPFQRKKPILNTL